MNDTLWVTGVSGFTGTHLVNVLRRARTPVRLVGLDLHAGPSLDLDACRTLDLADADAVARAAAEDAPRWVIHLAGMMPPASEADMWRVNVGGTVGLMLGLRAAGALATKIVNVGSAAEYAHHARSPLSEGAACGGASAYGNSKLAQSLTCLRLAADNGMHVTVARPFNLIGPGLPTRLIAGSLVHQFRAGSVMHIGNRHTARDFVDVRDAVRAYWLLAEHGEPGGIYNISTDTPVRIDELIETLASVGGRTPQVNVDESRVRAHDQLCVFGNSQRLRSATGWRPELSLETSLRDMLEQT
jgi:GDP-4-dehydro-6-deoxy-D-mannose reductase